MPENQVSQNFIIEKMQEHKFSQDEIRMWKNFFDKISSLVFYDENKLGGDDKKIFDEAKIWIDKFRDRL
jgi:hypothetical protein